ncbi:MAG: acylphosphatase [Aggregatilineaceae bacterium]
MADTPSEELLRLHALVHGHVQGVYFRATTQHEAVARGLKGWVRNRWDGTVEVVAEGPRAALASFEVFLHQGPPGAHVTHVDIAYSPATGEFSGFNIRY